MVLAKQIFSKCQHFREHFFRIFHFIHFRKKMRTKFFAFIREMFGLLETLVANSCLTLMTIFHRYLTYFFLQGLSYQFFIFKIILI